MLARRLNCRAVSSSRLESEPVDKRNVDRWADTLPNLDRATEGSVNYDEDVREKEEQSFRLT